MIFLPVSDIVGGRLARMRKMSCVKREIAFQELKEQAKVGWVPMQW